MPRTTSMMPPNRPPYPSFSLVVYCAFLPPPEPFAGPAPTAAIEDVPVVALPTDDDASEGELTETDTVDYHVAYDTDRPRVTFIFPESSTTKREMGYRHHHTGKYSGAKVMDIRDRYPMFVDKRVRPRASVHRIWHKLSGLRVLGSSTRKQCQ